MTEKSTPVSTLPKFNFFSPEPIVTDLESLKISLPTINPENAIIGNLINNDYFGKPISSIISDQMKILPSDLQSKLNERLMPEINACIDPLNHDGSLSLTEEFEMLVSKTNSFLNANSDEHFERTSRWLPNYPKDGFVCISNTTKHLAYISRTVTHLESSTAYLNHEDIKEYVKLVGDMDVLFRIANLIESISNKLLGFFKLVQEENDFDAIRTNKIIQSSYTEIQSFLSKQTTMLSSDSVEQMKQKRNKLFIKNVLIPKFQLLLESWKDSLSREPLLYYQGLYQTRASLRSKRIETLVKTISSHEKVKSKYIINEPSMDQIRQQFHDMVKGFQSLESSNKDSNFGSDPFDAIAKYSLNCINFTSNVFPALKSIIHCLNINIYKTQSAMRICEEKIKQLSKCHIHSIVDGVIGTKSLLEHSNPEKMNITHDFMTHVATIHSNREIEIFSCPNNDHQSLESWPNGLIDVGSNFNIEAVFLKGSWMVVSLIPSIKMVSDLNHVPFFSSNPLPSIAKISYCLVYQLDTLQKTIKSYASFPFYGILKCNFLEDNDIRITEKVEKSRINNLFFILFEDLELYELNLLTMEIRFICITVPNENPGAIVGGGLKKILFINQTYFILTNNNFLLYGSLDPTIGIDNHDTVANTKIEFLQLNVPKDIHIVDFAIQGNILALGLSNGMAEVIDRHLKKSLYKLRPNFESKPKHLQKGRDNVVSTLVFNSNEELMFYFNNGSNLSWKIKNAQ